MGLTRSNYRQGMLTAVPQNGALKEDQQAGIHPLQLDAHRDGFIYVPRGYHPAKPAALAVMLHGAGGMAAHGLDLLKSYADENEMILLAPASRYQTWDIIARDSFDADVIFIDQALTMVFTRYTVDVNRIAIGGFSDGASYALSIGLGNGQLFTHIIAFSPGFYFCSKTNGKPAVFISHGVSDQILPIGPCSRRIVPDLQRQGYTVNYIEFEGGHDIPAFASESAVEWFRK